MPTNEEVDNALTRALRGRKTAVDGLSNEQQSIDDLLKIGDRDKVDDNTKNRVRSVLYQRMRPTSTGDFQ